MAATGIFFGGGVVLVRVLMLVLSPLLSGPSERSLKSSGASVGVGFKVRLGFVVAWCSFVVDLWSSIGVMV
ncbi:hypothetical protein V8E51_014159 [Hyaloscypha variabilis]